MPVYFKALAFLSVAIAVIVPEARAADPLLYTAGFADGTRVAGGQLVNWHDAAASPQLNGKPLFDAVNPARWLLVDPPGVGSIGTTGLPSTDGDRRDITPEACIEFVGGDRLPGNVEAYCSGTDDWLDRQPPYLLVKPRTKLDLPGKPARSRVRVAVDAVRRIVWQNRKGLPAKPATLYLNDGREIAFRSLRWSSGGVLLLLDQDTTRIPFEDIAELCMPSRDSWDAYFNTIAMLSPDGLTRLMRSETFDGLIATTSLERFRATGNAGDARSWLHVMQPAWSLEPLWISNTDIRMRRFFMPHDVPLSMLEPTTVHREAQFGDSWSWQTDRNVQGDSLHSNGIPFGWGFGVQARCDLVFQLPRIAKAFRSSVGIDQAARRGGCVKASIHTNTAKDPPLWQSGYLVGSSEVIDTGSLPLVGPDGGQRTLVLVADMAHDGRPAGADPFDIRDMTDWLEPVLSLDVDALKASLPSRLPNTIPAWRGWNVDASHDSTLLVKNVLDASVPADVAGYRRQALLPGDDLAITRECTVTPDQKYLAIALSRSGATASRFEIRVDGQSVAVADVPERKLGGSVTPFLFPLDRFTGKTIQMELVHLPTDVKSFVNWHMAEQVGPLGTQWRPLTPVSNQSEKGATFTTLEDASILVGGPSPATDVHTIGVRTDATGLTALRVEALRDDSLPAGGPGRTAGGHFMLGTIEAEATSIADPSVKRKIVFSTATASFEQGGFPASAMIDQNPNSGWAAAGSPLNEPVIAMLSFAEPVGFEGGTTIVLSMRYPLGSQKVLGRFRLAATTDPQPALGLPGVLLKDRIATP